MGDISILWPAESGRAALDFSECVEDLELGRLCTLMFSSLPPAEGLEYASKLATTDVEAIELRQEVIADLLNQPELVGIFEEFEKIARDIRFYSSGVRDNARGLTSGDVAFDSMKKFIDGLEKLLSKNSGAMFDGQETSNFHAQVVRATIFTYKNIQAYEKAVSLLRSALSAYSYSSRALKALKAWVLNVYETDSIEKTKKKLSEIDKWWTGIESFSVDAAVSPAMMISSLEISSINSEPYRRTGMLDKGAEEGYDGLTSIFNMPQSGTTALYQEFLISELGISAAKELQKLKKEVISLPLSGRADIIDLGTEMQFYIAAARMMMKLKDAGMDIARPKASASDIMRVEDAYMIELALLGGTRPVSNDISMPFGGTINLLTGANSSGKTTYVIAAGQLQWLYQLGCWLPCKSAEMGVVDAIYTLFASGESETGEDSRMGMEVIKIGKFKDRMTSRSLVLLNEPMTSTSAIEGIEICIELIMELIARGVSGMLVTHYNEIYELVRERLGGGADKLQSYVMDIEHKPDGVQYTYKLIKSPPGKSSYAQAVVSKYGVTLSAMLEKLTARGVKVRPDSDMWQTVHGRGQA